MYVISRRKELAAPAKVESAAVRYAEIANSIGITGTVNECVTALCNKIVEMNNYMGIPNTLKEFGIVESEFKEKNLACYVYKANDT